MDEMTSLEGRKLDMAVESGKAVRIYIVNGFQIVGTVMDYDCNVVTVHSNGRELMVYRHAISTIDFGGC